MTELEQNKNVVLSTLFTARDLLHIRANEDYDFDWLELRVKGAQTFNELADLAVELEDLIMERLGIRG